MTKLEEKLIELGYEQDIQNQFIYIKFKRMCDIWAYLNEPKNRVDLELHCINPLDEQQMKLDILIEEYNEMKKDLEVLKEYE